eukprot:COSAG02_NODE_9_length_59728_cov_36.104714_49_plen_95_part_00
MGSEHPLVSRTARGTRLCEVSDVCQRVAAVAAIAAVERGVCNEILRALPASWAPGSTVTLAAVQVLATVSENRSERSLQVWPPVDREGVRHNKQ